MWYLKPLVFTIRLKIKIDEIIIKVRLIKSSLLINLSSEYFQVHSLVDIASKP